ncbi:hypothetical protein K7432_016788 [Basidiobolus ranarum]|uniref:Gfo/Idh/MocA-like oxidoreductase N-terminal domain-containing protein n=1 Tax=Basidiobolus ranarum TaxID=34480 RepID=A0ABR2WE86_9FUNG
MSSKINLGIIGLSAANSWASNAHYPYLKDSDKYRIAAISNSKLESSEAAAEKYGIPREHAHASADSIAADRDVNLVVVSVKVPYHKQLLLPAIKAKKDVFSEWPLGANLEEAQEIAHLAQEAGVRTMVGLQARQDVAINEAKKLVDSGKLGEILSTSFMGYGLAWTDIADESNAYGYDIKNGATLTTIPSGHSLDAICYVLGEFETVSATAIRD